MSRAEVLSPSPCNVSLPRPISDRAGRAELRQVCTTAHIQRRQTGGGRSSHGGRQAVPADRRLEPSERRGGFVVVVILEVFYVGALAAKGQE